jgi:adenylate cyclase
VEDDPAVLEERLLGGPLRYSPDEVAAAAGVTDTRARRYWRAMGFADVSDASTAFTDADLDALRRLLGLLREAGLDDELGISLTRALGYHMSRLVMWQVIALVEQFTEQAALGPEQGARAAVGFATEHIDDLERLLVYAWRRQLAAVAGRTLARGGQEAQRFFLTVGFADLVAFTRLSQRLTERQLARLVSRFESVSTDVVAANHGRVIKTVGDEVLFVADRAEDAARIAVGLARAMAADAVLPDVRVGLATGSLLSRLGDIFGRTVNLASRLTAMARPGSVLVDRVTAQALAGSEEFVLDRKPVRAVRGLGLVEPFVLRRADRPDRSG